MGNAKSELGVTPLEESLPLLNKLLSPYTGIAHLRFHMMAQPSDPRMWHVTCLAADATLTIGSSVPQYSGGIHPKRERAVAAALGEAAERYSLSYVPFESLRFSSAAKLGAPHVDPAKLNFFAERQYSSGNAYQRFDSETPVQWTVATDLRTGKSTWIPSAFCYLPDHRRPTEPRIVYSTSSGAACAPTKNEALLSGLYELVERDAFLLMWYNRLSMPIVDTGGVPEIAFDDRHYYDVTGLNYTVVDLSEFCDVPSAMAIVRDSAAYIKLVVGAASGRTMTDAVGKAVREAFQTYAWARQMRFLKPDWSEPEDDANIRDFEDHVALHAFGSRQKAAAFMDASPVRRHISEVAPLSGPAVKAQIEALLARLHARGMDVYSIDVTAPDLRELGLHVIRAFCPQLCQIDSDHGNRFLASTESTQAHWPKGNPAGGSSTTNSTTFRTRFRKAATIVNKLRTINAIELVYGSEDVEQALLDDPAEYYHEASKLYRSRALRQTDAYLIESNPNALVSTLRSSKRITHLHATKLPAAQFSDTPLGDLLYRRRSTQTFSSQAITLQQLATILFAAYGVTKRMPLKNGVSEQIYRTAPSGGGLFPLDVYAAVHRVDGLSPAIYYYDSLEHSLVRVYDANPTELLAQACIYPQAVSTSAITLLLSASFWRSRFKYRMRAYRFTVLEAGHVAQNALLAAISLGLGALPLGGFFESDIDGLLKNDGVNEGVLYSVGVGAL